MSTVISVENLGKKYLLNHQARQGSYVALRDVLTDGARSIGRRLLGRGSREGGREEFWALSDVSFEVKRGDRIGIIGRNGAGKSTLLKILSRITEPSAGSVRIKGRVASLLEVGTGFHPELTGRENIFLNGAILGMGRAEIRRRFDEIVAFAEVEKFLDTPVKRYSSGMYVRLAFAVAAHLEPEILIVDEVLAVGDAQFQKKCLGKMEDVSSRHGRTVLFVSHNMAAISNFCNRSILLSGGKSVLDAPPRETIEKYLALSSELDCAEESGVFSYQGRTNPCSAGDTIVKRVRLLDSDGFPRTSFAMGDPLRVEVETEGVTCGGGTEVSVTFNSQFGQRVCTINTGMVPPKGPLPRSLRQVAVLDIPRLPFTSGEYGIEVVIAQRGCGYLDHVPQAATFTVVDADVYGTGYELSSFFGFFCLDAAWSVKERG